MEQRVGVRGCDSLSFSGWLMGCCVCVHVHTHTEMGCVWQVGRGTGLCLQVQQRCVYVIALYYVMCVVWEVCGMVPYDLLL